VIPALDFPSLLKGPPSWGCRGSRVRSGPARYLVAYFPIAAVQDGALVDEHRTTGHRDLGDMAWYTVAVGDRQAAHAAWRYPALDGRKLALEPGQTVIPHGIDRGLDPDEIPTAAASPPAPSRIGSSSCLLR
jgi:Domain of unknown function (DUF427)